MGKETGGERSDSQVRWLLNNATAALLPRLRRNQQAVWHAMHTRTQVHDVDQEDQEASAKAQCETKPGWAHA